MEGCEDVDWIHLAQIRDQSWVNVKAVMNLIKFRERRRIS
jgi:hypothetical protein